MYLGRIQTVWLEFAKFRHFGNLLKAVTILWGFIWTKWSEQAKQVHSILWEVEKTGYAVWPDWAIFFNFGQPFKAGGNNYFTQIAHIVRQF